MKKNLILLVMSVLFATAGNAQILKGLFNGISDAVEDGKKASSELFDNVAKSFGSDNIASRNLTKEALCGTWTYNGVACELVSDDALLNFASKAITSKVEDMADANLERVGVKPGITSVTFKNDGSCVISVKDHEIYATYKLLGDNKVELGFLLGQVSVKADVVYSGSSISAMCDADKLLSIIKKLAASGSAMVDSESMEAINMLYDIVEGYDGLKLGLRLSK